MPLETARAWWLSLSLLVFAIVGCAGLAEQPDPPKVTLASFRSLPAAEGGPQFEIGLRIINPNDQPLEIAGISYGVELLGRELVAGVTDKVPVVAPYSENVVNLHASLQLIALLRLMADLGSGGNQPLAYRVTAKIDFRGLAPTQRLEETGEITLQH